MLVNTDFNGSVEAKTYTYKLTETEPAPGYKIDTFRTFTRMRMIRLAKR